MSLAVRASTAKPLAARRQVLVPAVRRTSLRVVAKAQPQQQVRLSKRGIILLKDVVNACLAVSGEATGLFTSMIANCLTSLCKDTPDAQWV